MAIYIQTCPMTNKVFINGPRGEVTVEASYMTSRVGIMNISEVYNEIIDDMEKAKETIDKEMK